MNPYVFFVGCPRSGTTLLRRIGDAHPKLAIVRELHWAGRFPTWDENPVTTTALFWEWNVRLGREATGLLGPERYYELRSSATRATASASREELKRVARLRDAFVDHARSLRAAVPRPWDSAAA